MKKNFFLFGILWVLIIDASAQRVEHMRSEMYSGNFEPISRSLNYSDIEGSPYLDDDLIKGYVKFKLGDSAVHFLRYNIYTDEIEYLEGKQLFIIKNATKVEKVYVNEHTLFYKTYSFRNAFKEGYLEKVLEGPYSLYLKYDVDFEPRKAAQSSYDSTKPARFITKVPTWYCAINNAPIKDFDKDDFEELFGDNYAEVKKYIKAEKLKLKKKEDMIKLFEYYNAQFVLE